MHMLKSQAPLPQNLIVFEDKVIKEMIKLNEAFRVGPKSNVVSDILIKRRETPGMCVHKEKAMYGHNRKAAFCKPRRGAS